VVVQFEKKIRSNHEDLATFPKSLYFRDPNKKNLDEFGER
jgi:hypothetical protein